MEQKNETVEKKKSGVVWIIVLLVFVVGIGVGLLVPSLLIKSENSNTPEQKEKEKEKDNIVELSEADVSGYFDSIESYNKYFMNLIPGETKNIDNQAILSSAWALATYYNDRRLDPMSDFSKEQMKEFVSRIFGKGFTYTDENINCSLGDGAIFQFDGATYHRTGNHGHDGIGFYRFQKYFVGASRNDTKGTLEIQMKVIYGDKCGGTCGPIHEYFKTPNGEVLYTSNSSDPAGYRFDELYNQYGNDLPITSYLYKKGENGDYYLESVQIK